MTIVKTYYRVERRVEIIKENKFEWWQDPETFPGKSGSVPFFVLSLAMERAKAIKGQYGQETRIVKVQILEEVIPVP